MKLSNLIINVRLIATYRYYNLRGVINAIKSLFNLSIKKKQNLYIILNLFLALL